MNCLLDPKSCYGSSIFQVSGFSTRMFIALFTRFVLGMSCDQHINFKLAILRIFAEGQKLQNTSLCITLS
jgi:hypothetical protein